MIALPLTEGILFFVSSGDSRIFKQFFQNRLILYKMYKNLLEYLTWFYVQ